ncbi:ubiquinone/menaquinone biosynthesis C-methylase UbiE [Natronocella acetinitrilica]|uniref:Ubiquinone/menaquinone biosynthesis C-methylase UbiE n=1 Tax=Natronocella acetinitrilica TaxID=414046 RepID=A0AAE3KDL8_9GAMM|nr:class I SAM-dependent methyltransferase [Natronocella acetinitrilica]MCP1677001.1 ubiquinone/menaquinone biosynthesis C-methylase UbiE [Natronocella acetinitrilica]
MGDQQQTPYVPALGFRWLTPFYDQVVARTTREGTVKTALIRQAGLEHGHQVVDLACGTGTLALWAKQAYPDAEVTGIDADAEMLSMARGKIGQAGVRVRFVHAMSFELPFADASVDRVLSSLFFHHLNWGDKQRTAREVYRILRPGGEVHIADWGKATSPLMRGLFVPIQLLDGFPNTGDNVNGRLPQLLEEAGFIAVFQTQTYSTMFGTMALYRASKPAVQSRPVHRQGRIEK